MIFLNVNLYEEIYTEKPEVYVLNGNEQNVWNFVKFLYRLKQALE